MNTQFAMDKAGGREKLAKLLEVEVITTYHWKPTDTLPEKHLRFLRAARPKWFREWEDARNQAGADPVL